jgi:divalent metal cation (Fe/Co/Zn/Cd) transporter
LSNSIALVTVVGGYYWRPWLDPIGGILIALIIMNGWLETGFGMLVNFETINKALQNISE